MIKHSMSAFLFCKGSEKMIEEYIESGLYKEALEQLTDTSDEYVRYQRLVCLYGLKELFQAKQEGILAKANAKETYYDVVSIYLSVLKDLEEYEEAINIIIEELSMPYIPYQYETMFNAAYDELLLAKQESNALQQIKHEIFNEEELSRILTSPVNEDLLYMAIDQLNGMNVRTFLHDIAICLSDENKPSEAKSLLLEVLIDQQVEEDFKVVKNGREMDINPYYLTKISESDAFNEISHHLISNLEDENPSLLMVCLEFLSYYFYFSFPMYIDESEYCLIGASIHYYIASLQYIDMDIEDIAFDYQVESDEILEKIDFLKQIEV